jgi:predicted ATPase/DNA-binding CsgD family transcriptional regulator
MPSGPFLVERERELEALRGALAKGRRGEPSVVAITGEPGIGKSYLLRALSDEPGVTLLRGFSLEADTPPYFPLRRALARLDRADALPNVGAARPVLAAAGIVSAGGSAEAGAADRLAVFDALTELFISLAAEAPVLLVLDDMQWASTSAWEAVSYLARAAEGAAITVVVASRPEGIEPTGPGADAIAELRRNGLLQLLRLKPLTPEGTAKLVSNLLDGEPAPPLLAALAARTEGNPFFVEEVVRSLTEAGLVASTPAGLDLTGSGETLPLPQSLKLATSQRLRRLPEAAVQTLQAAATVGRMFDLSLVAAMLGQPAEWVAARLAPAARAGIVAEETAGRWTFAHDALRDTVLSEIGDERAQLHRAAARALLERNGSAELETAAAIARHLAAAGDIAEAIQASLTASALALQAQAAQEALALAEMAGSLLDQAAGPSRFAPDVQRAIARAASAAGAYSKAESAWAAVLSSTNDLPEQARVLVSIATVARKAERSDAAAEYFQQALDLLEGGGDSRTLMEALVELSTLEGTTRSDYEAAVGHGERALALARKANDGGMEARAALALANARARLDTPATARPMLSLALDRSLQANDLAVAAEAAASLSNSFYWTGELRSALAYAHQRLDISQRGRDAFALRHAHTWLALLATTEGDWQTAREMVAQAEPAIARLGSPEPLGFLRLVEGLLALRTGELDLALTRTEEAMRLFGPLGDATISWYVAVRIWALIAAGREAEAAQECAAQEARLLNMPESALPARSSRCGLGRAYVAFGDLARAAECEAKLLPFADDFHWRPARLTLAATAALRGDREHAMDLLEQVHAFAQQNGLTYDAADARRISEALAAGAEAQVAFARPDAPALAAPPAPGGTHGLSPREVEVLRLVAQGLTNREIAERLVLSERTVINHVSHIFEKTGVESRSAATAFAFRAGLVQGE